MANLSRFPFKRDVRLAAAYRLRAGKASLGVLQTTAFGAEPPAPSAPTVTALSISSYPISAGPISGLIQRVELPAIIADVDVVLDAFTLTADTLVRGNVASASLTWSAFTLTSEVDWGRRLVFTGSLAPFTLTAIFQEANNANLSVALDPFTLTATFQEANNANLTATLAPFTVEAFAEVDTDAEVNVSLDAFTLESSLDNRIDLELSANWDPFTLDAFTEYKFRFTRLPATPATITRPLSSLPSTITRNGTVTRETRITI